MKTPRPIERRRIILNLSDDGNASNVCKHVWPIRSERTLQRDVAYACCFLKRLENLKFATAVCFALAFGEFAGDGVGMGKMIDCLPAGFQNHLVAAYWTIKRSIPFMLKIRGDDLAVGFSLGAKHGEKHTIIQRF